MMIFLIRCGHALLNDFFNCVGEQLEGAQIGNVMLFREIIDCPPKGSDRQRFWVSQFLQPERKDLSSENRSGCNGDVGLTDHGSAGC